jgi:hypothetical protein
MYHQKKGALHDKLNGGPLFCLDVCELDYFYIYCSRAFIPLLYVKGNSVAFIERLEAGCIDSRMMNEYISTVFLLNEAIAFAVIKPFYSSIGHGDILLSDKFSWFHT